jgi:MFS family permease
MSEVSVPGARGFVVDRLLARLGVPQAMRPRVEVSVLLGLTTILGINTSRIARDAYFLGSANADDMPLMYVCIAVVMMIVSSIYSRLADRVPARPLFVRMQWGAGLFSLVVWGAVEYLVPSHKFSAYVIFCLVECLSLLMTLQLWAAVSTVFSTPEGKIAFPLVGAGGLLGTILGGTLASTVSSFLTPSAIFLIWPVVIPASLWAIGQEEKRARTLTTEANAVDATESESDEAQEGSNERTPIFSLPLARTLAYMTLPLWTIVYIVEWSYFGTMDRVFPDTAQLGTFLGGVVSLSAYIGLFIQLVLLPRFLVRLGVGGTILLYPLSLLAGTVALLAFCLLDGGGHTALPIFGIALFVVLARLCDIAVYFSIYESSEQLLYYAIPEVLRDRMRVLQSGKIVPISMGIAGMTLLFLNGAFTGNVQPNYSVAFVALGLAFLLVVTGLNLTPDYLRARVARTLFQRSANVELLRSEIIRLSEAEARYILVDCLVSPRQDEAHFAADWLFANPVEDLFSDVTELLPAMEASPLERIARHLADVQSKAGQLFLADVRARLEECKKQMAAAT